MCPPATYCAFLSNDPCLTPKIRWHLMWECPTGILDPSGRISKALEQFFISFLIASIQKVVPVLVSKAWASWTLFGISIPYFWWILCYRFFMALMILSRFFTVWGTHQAKAGYPARPLFMAYWATWSRCGSFTSLSGCQEVVPSFHWHKNYHPLGVCLGSFLPALVVMIPSSLETVVPSFLWSTISFSMYWV